MRIGKVRRTSETIRTTKGRIGQGGKLGEIARRGIGIGLIDRRRTPRIHIGCDKGNLKRCHILLLFYFIYNPQKQTPRTEGSIALCGGFLIRETRDDEREMRGLDHLPRSTLLQYCTILNLPDSLLDCVALATFTLFLTLSG
eukprot:scaffold1690_cov182-Amphora_coffeaeformis.AAC.40